MNAKRAFLSLLNHTPSAFAAHFTTSSRAAAIVRPLLNRLVPGEDTIVCIRSGAAAGLFISIDPRREKFYWSGTHEPAVQDAFVSFVPPGATVWDVGAHAGFYSFLAAHLVGPGGSVLAFEPVPANLTRLRSGIVANGFNNITVCPRALAAAAGRATFFSSTNTSMGSLVPGQHHGEVFTVDTTTLDAIAQRAPTLPALVKLDIEGAEPEALIGGAELLLHARPILIVECLNGPSVSAVRAAAPQYDFLPLDETNYLGTCRTP
jgi:FkbM family methyltransferase